MAYIYRSFLIEISKSSAQELIYHEDLQPLGLSIQSRLRLMICSHCQSALLPKSVVRHFSDLHKNIHVQVNEKKILAVAQLWNLCTEMPDVASPTIVFQGLALLEGCIKCPFCERIFSQNTMPSHHSTDHAGIPTPGFNQLVPIYAQKLNNGNHKSLFEVIVPVPHASAPLSINIIIDHLRTSRDNLIPQYFPTTIDPRSLSSWMKYTGWHTFVELHDTSTLIAYVAMPQKHEPTLERLKIAVTSIFNTGYQDIDNTNIIVLQKLKTEDQMGQCVIHLFNEYCRICIKCYHITEFQTSPSRNFKSKVQGTSTKW